MWSHRTAAELAGIEAAIAQRSARLLISPLNGAMPGEDKADSKVADACAKHLTDKAA